MKIVAVSQRADSHADRREQRDALDQRLCEWLLQAGYLPVPVPNQLNAQLDAWLAAVKPHALLLSGGNDIGEAPARDDTERRLLDHAQARSTPVLGLCRGMQMMSVWSGTQLVPCEGHVRVRHNVRGGINQNVNSYHNFALAACPSGFTVTARSEDGVIEAIRHTTLAWEAWMWHPEREPEFDQRDLQRVRDLFQ